MRMRPPWTLDLSAYESDAEDSGTDLDWSVSGVDGALFTALITDSDNDILTFTPVAGASGSDVITLTLTDSGGQQATQDITVTLTAVNDAPTILGTIPDQSKAEDAAPWTLDLSSYESDAEDSGTALDWSVSGVNGALFSAVMTDSDNDLLTFSPVAGAAGSDVITLTLTDSGGRQATQDITVTLTAVNDAPTIINGPIPDQSQAEDAPPWTLDLSAYESDAEDSGTDLDWSVSGVDGALFTALITDSDNDILTFTPVAGASGSDVITLTLTDSGGQQATQDITVTLTAVNDDYDGDGVPNIDDNCPYVPNTKQTDTFPNGEGDACQGLIAYYPLTGNANDFSGYDNHGTVNGATPTSDRNGNSNSAFSFDGVDDLIQISDSDSLDIGFSDYTIVAWIMTEATTNTGRIFSKGSFGCSTGYMMRMGGTDSSRAFLENAFNNSCQIRFQSDTLINDNRWHLVVGVVDRDVGGKIYIDGNLDSQQVVDTSSYDLSNDNNPTIGQYDVGTQVEPFSGVIDEVRIYSRALSESEIAEIYTESLNQGLVAHYPFDGDANDNSGNGNDGSVIGATLTADRFGNPNSAYNFDGVNDYIKASADNLPTAERTVSLWFFANSNDRMVHLGYGGSGPPGTSWFMGINGWGQSIFYMSSHYDNNTIKYFYSQPPGGAWYHFVAASDPNGTRIYINGVEEATNSNYVANTIVQNKDLSIGVCVGPYGTAPYVDANVGYFNGIIDDVRIYNRALSDAEIQTLSYEGASQIDTDGDGIPDFTDPDDDNDNVADADDTDPLNANICRDVDADGCDDCSSGTDDPANDGTDTDSDGLCDLGDLDDDNDNVADADDTDPLNASICRDVDADGCDDCTSGTDDPANDGTDTDTDGLCDLGDPDADGDGFDSLAAGGTDCNDLNASAYPGAQEIPGDGIDQDCDGSDAVNIIPDIPYYVDPVNGTDDGAHGTADAGGAWRTLHYAIDLINGGTIGTYSLTLAAGTYTFTSEDNDTPVVINQDIIITGTGVILDGSGDHGDAENPWTSGLLLGPGAANVTIEGLSIENFKNGILLNSDGGCLNLAGVVITGLRNRCQAFGQRPADRGPGRYADQRLSEGC